MLPLGRVSGHRGRSGELTVRVAAGDAGVWSGLGAVWLGGEDEDGRLYTVQRSRSYRDRLVLKLEGIEDADAAARLRGLRVMVPERDAPELPEGLYYTARLVGLLVVDESGSGLGRVRDVMPTGGVDLLVVERSPEGTEEVLIPLAPEIVLEVREDEGRIIVRPPKGLLELNRPAEDRQD